MIRDVRSSPRRARAASSKIVAAPNVEYGQLCPCGPDPPARLLTVTVGNQLPMPTGCSRCSPSSFALGGMRQHGDADANGRPGSLENGRLNSAP